MAPSPTYLPAAGRDIFLPLYDPLTRLLGIGRALEALIAQAGLLPGHAVLDIGCGTGTLVSRIARTQPGVVITGLDPDPHALARARRKASRAGLRASFEQGFAEALPFGEGAFDRVFSSMMFHHLHRDVRPAVLAEVRRVLKPGGRLEFLDFAGGAHNMLAQLLHGHELHAAAEDRLLRRMAAAGLTGARQTRLHRTLVGTLAYYQATRSGA